MMMRLHGLSIPYDANQEKELQHAIKERLGNYFNKSHDFKIARRSIDARQRPIKINYSVDIDLNDISYSKIPNVVKTPEKIPLKVESGKKPLLSSPIVVGGGPAGLFAALLLAEHNFSPILLERGGTVKERVQAKKDFTASREVNTECNALFGLGGAGTFSDGKLKTGINHPWIKAILDILCDCGAPNKIKIDSKPHVGTEILCKVVENLTKRIVKAGGIVKTGIRVDELVEKNSIIKGVKTKDGIIECNTCILAIGHSARDTWKSLYKTGVVLEPKPFQLGIRIEHDQSWFDELRYGNAAGHKELGRAEYKLATKINNTSVFSFCMCPGGETIPTVNEKEHLAINGMSLSKRNSSFASSGMVVTLPPEIYGGKDLASCINFQREIEHTCYVAGNSNYSAPAQQLIDFVKGKKSDWLPKSSFSMGLTHARLDEILPSFVANPIREALVKFNKTIPGYLHQDAIAIAPESRASSPIRIVRNRETMESNLKGMYPGGEGAGYAGGIMSSALDGLNAAKIIIEKFAPPK